MLRAFEGKAHSGQRGADTDQKKKKFDRAFRAWLRNVVNPVINELERTEDNSRLFSSEADKEIYQRLENYFMLNGKLSNRGHFLEAIHKRVVQERFEELKRQIEMEFMKNNIFVHDGRALLSETPIQINSMPYHVFVSTGSNGHLFTRRDQNSRTRNQSSAASSVKTRHQQSSDKNKQNARGKSTGSSRKRPPRQQPQNKERKSRKTGGSRRTKRNETTINLQNEPDDDTTLINNSLANELLFQRIYQRMRDDENQISSRNNNNEQHSRQDQNDKEQHSRQDNENENGDNGDDNDDEWEYGDDNDDEWEYGDESIMNEEESIIHAKDEQEVQANLHKGAIHVVSHRIQKQLSVETPDECLESSDEIKRLRANVEEIDESISKQEKEMKEHEKRINEDMSKFGALKQMKYAIEKAGSRMKEVNDLRKGVEHLCSNVLESAITVRNHGEALANAKLLARRFPKGALQSRTDVAEGFYHDAISLASDDGLFDDAALERIIHLGGRVDDLAPLGSYMNVDNFEPLDDKEKAMAQDGAKIDGEGRITYDGSYKILESVAKVLNKEEISERVCKRLVDYISIDSNALEKNELSENAAKAWVAACLTPVCLRYLCTTEVGNIRGYKQEDLFFSNARKEPTPPSSERSMLTLVTINKAVPEAEWKSAWNVLEPKLSGKVFVNGDIDDSAFDELACNCIFSIDGSGKPWRNTRKRIGAGVDTKPQLLEHFIGKPLFNALGATPMNSIGEDAETSAVSEVSQNIGATWLRQRMRESLDQSASAALENLTQSNILDGERLQAVEGHSPSNVPLGEIKQSVEAELADLEAVVNEQQRETTRRRNVLEQTKEERDPLLRQLQKKKKDIITSADQLLQNYGGSLESNEKRIPIRLRTRSGIMTMKDPRAKAFCVTLDERPLDFASNGQAKFAEFCSAIAIGSVTSAPFVRIPWTRIRSVLSDDVRHKLLDFAKRSSAVAFEADEDAFPSTNDVRIMRPAGDAPRHD